MSVDPKIRLGNVAELQGLQSKPDLNGKSVLVGGYDAVKQRYSVQTFTDPSNKTPQECLSIKPANLSFYSSSFDEKYPNAPVTQDTFSGVIPKGVILDLANHTRMMPCLISSACSVRGARFLLGRPITRVSSTVFISPNHDADIVEFEDINFDAPMQGAAHCTSSSKIIFRRCRFHSLDYGCTASNSEVVFENCLFEDCNSSGVIVGKGGVVTMINCHVNRASLGVEVRDGGVATLLHCTISDSKRIGAIIHAKGRALTMKYCSVSRCGDSGVLIQDGGNLSISHCRVQNCGVAGIGIEGPSRSTATISDTVATGNMFGILVHAGKSTVMMVNCMLLRNNLFGLLVGPDAIGEVVVSGTSISSNSALDVNNDGGIKHTLMIDGKVQAQDGLKAQFTENMNNFIESSVMPDGFKPSLETLRTRKQAGIGSIYCTACGLEEPAKVKYNKCSRCLEVCYCSKECQVPIFLLY